MPSKRKKKKREDELGEEGWFAISSDFWREFGEIPSKLRIIADANFPVGLVDLIANRKFDIKTAQSLSLNKLDDEDLLQRIADRGYVLITLDRDFWSDVKFPLHQSGGVIFIDAKDESIGETAGFRVLLAILGNFGSGWRAFKFRASSERVFMKWISDEKFLYEVRAMRGGLYARRVRWAEA